MRRKKLLAVAAAVLMLSAAATMPVSAASKTWMLNVSQTESNAYLYNYNAGNAEYLTNYPSSHDGVNLYLYYKIPGKNYEESHHVFAEPGETIKVTRWDQYTGSTSTDWKGTMNSWWFNGKNCAAKGKFHAFN